MQIHLVASDLITVTGRPGRDTLQLITEDQMRASLPIPEDPHYAAISCETRSVK